MIDTYPCIRHIWIWSFELIYYMFCLQDNVINYLKMINKTITMQ